MKVAFLTSAQPNHEEIDDNFSAGTLKDIISVIGLSGWDVEEVSLDYCEPESPDTGQYCVPLTCLDGLSRFFRTADNYGLVFNYIGLVPLLMSGITETPMLTVLNSEKHRQLDKFYDSFASTSHFVWCEQSDTADHPLPCHEINFDESDSRDVATIIANGLVQAGKELLQRLKKEDHRPWGYYVVLSDLDDHKVKRIVVYPRKRLSLQSHKRRSEHWMVVSGKGAVTLDSREIELKPGDSVDIPVGTRHRMTNREDEPVVFIEVQTGDYFGEDDIQRYEDDFGRA